MVQKTKQNQKKLSRGIWLLENVIHIPDIWLAGETSQQKTNRHDALDCNEEKNKQYTLQHSLYV